MRIEAKDLREKKRAPLHQVIPLSAPFLLYVDPTNKCNFRCDFCPTADYGLLKQVGRKGATMDFATFEKIVRDVKEFGQPLKLLSMYKDGEPLMNPRLPDMIALAKKEGIAERVWTKSNGSTLNPELNQKLVDSGLDMIHISIESVTNEGYLKVAKVKFDYDELRENIADLYNRRGKLGIYVKIVDTGLSQEETEKFYKDFEGISTHTAVEKLMGWSNSGLKDFRLGQRPDTYDGLPLVPKKICAYPFYVLAVNADGSVSVCGNDWSYATSVGDVRKSSLKEIWHGEPLRALQRLHLEGRRGENAACGDCHYLQIVPDNLDPYATELLQKLAT